MRTNTSTTDVGLNWANERHPARFQRAAINLRKTLCRCRDLSKDILVPKVSEVLISAALRWIVATEKLIQRASRTISVRTERFWFPLDACLVLWTPKLWVNITEILGHRIKPSLHAVARFSSPLATSYLKTLEDKDFTKWHFLSKCVFVFYFPFPPSYFLMVAKWIAAAMKFFHLSLPLPESFPSWKFVGEHVFSSPKHSNKLIRPLNIRFCLDQIVKS